MPPIPVAPATGQPPVMVGGVDPVDAEPKPGDDPTLWDPLVCEVTPAGGQPEVVDWLGPGIEVERPSNDLPKARVPLILHDRFTVNTGTPEDPIVRTIEQALPNDAEIVIRTARSEPETDFTLFRGYAQLVSRTATAQPKASRVAASIDCVHIADDIAKDPERFIHGQLWLKKDDDLAFKEDPYAAVLPKVLTGWPVVFNPDGAKNCRANMVRLSDPEGGEHESGWPAHFYVPLWTHRYDQTRQAWSWARVFMFLWYWGRRTTGGGLGSLKHGLLDCNLWQIISDGGFHEIDPDDPGSLYANPWKRALVGKPVSLALEGMDWISALKWCCHRAGIGWFLDTWTDDGCLREGFRFFVGGEGRRTTLKMPSKHFETHDKHWTEVRQEADVSNTQIVSSFAGCVNDAMGAGGAKEYEVTVELLPGWKYDEDRSPQVDVDPEDVDAVANAITAIASEAWAAKYNRKGQHYRYNWPVLRKWVAMDCEDLSDPEQGYVRPWAPWGPDEEIWEALDLADLELGEVQSGPWFTRNMNAVMPRPLKRCLSGPGGGATFPPIVQLSFDAGASWWEMAIGINVLRGRLGVFFEVDDLRGEDLADPNPVGEGLSFPKAYIKGLARVRVTGALRADLEHFPVIRYMSAGSLSDRNLGRLVYRPGAFAYAIRDDRGGYSGGNSMYKGDAAIPATERFLDDYGLPVERFVELRDRLRHTGPVEIPGLRFWDTGWRLRHWKPGDEVEGLHAEEGQHDLDLSLRARGDTDDFAIIANVKWHYEPGDGKKRPPLARTTLTLEDAAALASFGK